MIPIVSVVIPTFNRQELTSRAIDSVRTRHPEAVEIVVIDDAGSIPFCYSGPANQSGVAVRVLRVETNGGPGLARRAGVQAAVGEIVAFLDSDDEFLDSWVDCLLETHAELGINAESRVMIAGSVENPQRVAGLVAFTLKMLPSPLRLGVARLLSVFFNPFYTPSIAITRSSARFHNRLRHCEDYFMTTVSLFQVDRLLLPKVDACRLGHSPNTPGGESGSRDQMWEGEITARRAIAQEPSVPRWYKALHPLGRAYQGARTGLKAMLKLLTGPAKPRPDGLRRRCDHPLSILPNEGTVRPSKFAFIGTAGVPASYGGFETLVDNLVHYHVRSGHASELTVWCSSKDNCDRPTRYESAQLRYIGLKANGAQSIPYDVLSLWDAIRTGHSTILLLGVSGAVTLPLVRLFTRSRIITNIDGIEWKREKWNVIARAVLRASEWAAVRFSHEIIADNQAIAEHVREAYGSTCHIIAYGGDHAVAYAGKGEAPAGLPNSYALALCRIEPENNIHTILHGWSQLDSPLVIIGNWTNSAYGRQLKSLYGGQRQIYLLDPIYEPATLYALRARASVYVHGHSAGGTNPSLVEMMHFGIPVLAHGCSFNRHSTEDCALYFNTAEDLADLVLGITSEDAIRIGACMREIAQRRYTWDLIGQAYFGLLE